MSLHKSNEVLTLELEQLKEQFARGDLSHQQFERMSQRLTDRIEAAAKAAVVIIPTPERGSFKGDRVAERPVEQRMSSITLFDYSSDDSTEMLPPDEEAPLSPRARVPDLSRQNTVPTMGARRKDPPARHSLQRALSPRARGGSVPEKLKQLKKADKPKVRAHVWVSKQCNKFTWCDHCKQFIYGLVLQALECERCERVIHRKCKYSVAKDCGITIKMEEPDSHDGGGLPHVFEMHHFSRFTYCALCNEFIYGLAKQGYKCRLCGYPCHKECKFRVLKTCTGTMSTFSAPDVAELNLHVNREALVNSCLARLDEEMGIGRDVPLVHLDNEAEWNALFVSLESDDFMEESSLEDMMQLVRQMDDNVKKMEKDLDDNSSAELVKSCLVISAEINLAKSEITKRWDYQQSHDDLRRVRSSGLQKREQALEDALLKPTNHAILLLFDQLAADGGDKGGDSLAQALLDVFIHHGSQLKLIEFFVQVEVRRCTAKNTLFRGNSLSTKILRAYCKQESSRFVKAALEGPIRKLTEFDLEIDPKKLFGDNAISEEEVKVRQAHLHLAIKLMINSIINARKSLSNGVFEVCACIYNVVVAKFPDSAISAVGGIIFLRVLSPVIVSPHVAGLVKEELEPHKRRTLMLICKALQCMSNQVEFSPSYMEFLTPLCVEYRQQINDFLLSLTMEPTFDDPRIPPSREKVRKNQKNLTMLREFLKHKDKSLLAELVEDPLLLEELEQIV